MVTMRILKLTANALIAALFLAGCDKLSAFNQLQAGDYQPTFTDLAYGDAPRHKLDLYLPNDGNAPAPLIVWFYGGSWDAGNKAQYAFVAKRFTEMGYAAGPMILAGHSAGAYNAVQLVANPDYLRAAEMNASDIAGIIGLSGPYDFYPYDVKATQNAFGDTPAVKSQPVEMDLTHMPPLLLITGTRDHTVYPHNSRNLAKLAPDAKLVEIPEAGHAGTLIALGFYLTTNDDVLEPVTSFLRVHLPTASDKTFVEQDKAS